MSAYSDLVLSLGPSMYWRLGEPSGTNANDETANNRDGTKVGGVTFGATGAIGGDADTAADIPNTGYFSSTYNPFTQNSSRSFCGWASRDATANIDCLLSSNATNYFMLQAETNRNLTFLPDGVSSNGVGWPTAWPNDTNYHQFALIYNDATKQASLYLDGALISTQTESSAGYNASPGNFQLGAKGSTQIVSWDGKMDEIVIFERLLSSTEVTSLYTGIAATASPITGVISATRR